MDKCDFDFHPTQQGDLMVSVADLSCRCRDTSSAAATATTCLSCLPKHVWIKQLQVRTLAALYKSVFIMPLYITCIMMCRFVYFYMQLKYLLHEYPHISILLCLAWTFMSHYVNFRTMFSKRAHNKMLQVHHKAISKTCLDSIVLR